MNGQDLLNALRQFESWELRDWDLFIGTGNGEVLEVVDVEIDKQSEAIVIKAEET